MPFSAIERDRTVVASKVGERGRRRRVGQVVGRHVNGLHRGDRTLGRGGDALLHLTHVGRQRRLIAHGRRNTAEKRRHFRTRLGEAEDVVDEEQHVLALVAEVLGDSQAGQGDAGAGARRLVHLAVDEGCLRAFAAAMLVDARLDHFVIEVVALAGALADAGEHRVTAMGLGDVVDQFHDENGLADAGAAEQADLAALGVRREQVDDLDAGDEDLRFGRLLDIGGRILVDGALRLGRERAGFVDRLADDIHDAAERLVADRHHDRCAGVDDDLAANQTFGGVHGDGAHGVFAEMLRDFENQAVADIDGLQRVQDRRQVLVELHVDDGADDLTDLAGRAGTELDRSGRLRRSSRCCLRRCLSRRQPWPVPPSLRPWPGRPLQLWRSRHAATLAGAAFAAVAFAAAGALGVAAFAIFVTLFVPMCFPPARRCAAIG